MDRGVWIYTGDHVEHVFGYALVLVWDCVLLLWEAV